MRRFLSARRTFVTGTKKGGCGMSARWQRKHCFTAVRRSNRRCCSGASVYNRKIFLCSCVWACSFQSSRTCRRAVMISTTDRLRYRPVCRRSLSCRIRKNCGISLSVNTDIRSRSESGRGSMSVSILTQRMFLSASSRSERLWQA